MRKTKVEKQNVKLTAPENSADTAANTIAPSQFPDVGERYQLLSFVSQGGMGTIFKARDSETDTILAVKVLNQDLASDKEAIKRFEQEIKTVSQLTHANLLTIYDQGITKDGVPFLVCDFVEGETLADYLKNKESSSTPAFDTLDLFMQICDALSFAHARGVIHRDVKPGNVILSRTDSGGILVKLVDFGIAKVMPSSTSQARETHSLTLTGGTFGTPSYMSPEQCLGFRLDERSDIYSLGCLMYEVATGNPPFAGDNPIQVVVSHIEKSPAAWSKKAQSYPGLEGIVLKCLEKDQGDRYQSIQQLSADLKRISEGEKVLVETKVREPAPVYSRHEIFNRAGELCLYGIYLFMLLMGSSEPSATFVFLLYPLIRSRIIQFGMPGSGRVISRQWPFLVSNLRVMLALSGALVCMSTMGFFEFLPQSMQFIVIGLYYLHMLMVAACSVGVIGGFFFGREPAQSKRKIAIRFFAMLMPLVVLIGLVLPFSAYTIAFMNSYSDGSYFMETSDPSPKLRVERYKIALLLNPGKDSTAEDLTSYLNELGRADESVQVLNDLIAKRKEPSTDLLRLRGVAYGCLGQEKKAIADINEAFATIRVNPTKTDSMGWKAAALDEALGDVYLHAKRYDKAAEEYTRAYDNTMDYSLSSSSVLPGKLAIARYRSGDVKGAIAAISRNCKKSHHSAQNFLQRALLYELSGETELALADYKTAKQILTRFSEEWRNIHAERYQSFFAGRISKSTHVSDLAKAYVYEKLGDKEKSAQCLEFARLSGFKKSDLLKRFCEGLGVELKW